VRAWIFSTISDAVKDKGNEFNAARLGWAESKRKHEREMKHSAVTCCVEILLVLFWLKRRRKLDGFGAAPAFGLDCLAVGVPRA